MVDRPRVGVLALQGAFAKHIEVLTSLGALASEVKTPAHLEAVDALVIPGGESSTMSKLLDLQGLREPLEARLHDGLPAFGTCAGMIMLATEILDGRADQKALAAIDISVRRNGYGRQIDSFEHAVDITGLAGEPFQAVFIRAPIVERVGDGVEVLGEVGGVPVVLRQGPVFVTSFHPELTNDLRLHEAFLLHL